MPPSSVPLRRLFRSANQSLMDGLYCRAAAQLKQILTIDPDLAPAYSKLGFALFYLDRNDEAITCFERALALLPNFPEALYYLSQLHLIRRDLQSAHDYALRLHLTGGSNISLQCAALSKANRPFGGEATDAVWSELRDIIAYPVFSDGPRARMKWDGSSIPGQTLVIYSSEGLGDQIQYVRYLPLVKHVANCSIILQCDLRLHSLFSHIYGNPIGDYVDSLVAPEKDLKTTSYISWDMGMSPLLAFVHGLHPPPMAAYLASTKKQHAAAECKLEDPAKYRIGICWLGNPKHWNDRNRSCNIREFIPILKIKDTEMHSLCIDEAGNIDHLTDFGVLVRDHSASMVTFADTAALMLTLDAIVTVDTAIAHLAGALGLPVWVLLPFQTDARWRLITINEVNQSVWYASMRLVKQSRPGSWSEAISLVSNDLDAFLNRRSRNCKSVNL